MELNQKQKAFVEIVRQVYGPNIAEIDRQSIVSLIDNHGIEKPWWLLNDQAYRVSRGVYRMPDCMTGEPKRPERAVKAAPAPAVESEIPNMVGRQPVRLAVDNETIAKVAFGDLIPGRVRTYVKFGHFDNVLAVVKSKLFYPIFVTGLSGNGKTMMVEQTCATAGREMIRVNITIETDEDDLLGGFRLVNGETVWHNGPVVTAMERGAVLLLDEIDLASNKIMCLQPVLEGRAIFLKKIGRQIIPAEGFTIIATANTKGRGSDDGKFIGTNVLNEAFLERFAITMEQEYPSTTVERRILRHLVDANDAGATEFVDLMVKWADIIRRSYNDGAVSDLISTRRLVHVCEAYNIFNKNKMLAINLCLSRFDNETKAAFMDLYTKVSGETELAKQAAPDSANTKVSF